MRESVLIIHGLAENPLWMKAIEFSLRIHGYEAHTMGYPSTTKDIDTLTKEDLHQAVTGLNHAETLHLVGHSLGCILIRNYLRLHDIPNLGRIVMLAPGNAGSPTITFLKQNPFFSWFLGPAGIQSADDETCFACTLPDNIKGDLGIIAGCIPLDLIGLMTMPWPHDGKTTLEGTKLDSATDHIVVAASHDTILIDPQTLLQTCYFLKNGKFLKVPLPLEPIASSAVV